ncbi:MAG: restriction endonuclease, partial [Myxococcaceae bacterium]|nr:restriction endonuclease [Myxococcaceae bacterium]
MTFYEAALRVLEQSGKPLSHIEITTKSIEGGLLSHVGKLPEQVMLARLAAMAKRPRDRKVMVTAKDTFALTDWMLEEDAAALAATGIREPNPEEDLPPLRPIERHPEPRTENARGVGRQSDRRSRRDEERERRRKYPPIAEVVFELLSESSPLTGAELLERARAKEQASNELQLSQVLWALVEDNQRRIDSGRRPQFHYTKPAEGEPVLGLDAGSELPPAEVQQNFCTVAQIPFENGRAVLRQRPSHDGAAAATPLSAEDLQLVTQAKTSVKDARRVLARAFRKKLLELELGVLEKAVVRLLHALRFREVKVAKRSRDGLLMMARRREGSLELRYALRLLRGAQSVERRHVQELKRDASHHGANLGIVVAPGDVRGDAKSEALSGALTFLWCGEGLADQFFDAEVGVIAQKLTLCEVDEAFFAEAARSAEEAKLRREERRNEREQEERGGEGMPAAESSAPRPPSHAEAEASAVAADEAGPDGDAGADDGEGDDDGPEGAADAAGTP